MYISKQSLIGYFLVLFLLLYSSHIIAAIDPDYISPVEELVARNDVGNITANKDSSITVLQITGNVLHNDFNGIDATLISPMTSQYGSLAFDNTGNYTYSLFNDNPNINQLAPTNVLKDVFTYVVSSFRKQASYATLTINISGAPNGIVLRPGEEAHIITARDDVNYIVRDTDTSVTSLVINGNVSTNDINSTNFTLNSSTMSAYGVLALASDGNYTYGLFNNNPTVQALEYNQTITDTFVYSGSNDVGQSDTATLTINILGSSDNAVIVEPGEDSMTVRDDTNNITRDPSAEVTTVTVDGNVMANDTNVFSSTLVSDIMGIYGSLIFSDNGDYTYTLFNNADEILDLNYNEYLIETFTYKGTSPLGRTDEGLLTITIFGSLGIIADNVEIEPNDNSRLSTPLNSAQNIKGHLQSGGDKDFYSIKSLGNEIIHLEVCPPGSACSEGKAWVMYVFDSAKLTLEEQNKAILLDTIGDDTGTLYSQYSSTHLYLQNYAGVYDNSLIGIIDPCFGTASGLDIGVGNGARTYFIAISAPLERDGGGCDSGSVVLTRPGPKGFYQSTDEEGVISIESEETTQEYIAIFPNNDDQYIIKATRTGINPLTDSSVQSALLADGRFTIPKLRIDEAVYSVDFNLKNTQGSQSIKLDLASYQKLDEVLTGEQIMAIYDSKTNLVRVPKYLNEKTQELYSLIFFYNPMIEVLELIEYTLID